MFVVLLWMGVYRCFGVDDSVVLFCFCVGVFISVFFLFALLFVCLVFWLIGVVLIWSVCFV